MFSGPPTYAHASNVFVNTPSHEINDMGWTMVRTAELFDKIFVVDVPVGPNCCAFNLENSHRSYQSKTANGGIQSDLSQCVFGTEEGNAAENQPRKHFEVDQCR